MEEKKTLKIKKTRLIIFALAIAFAIMGIIDLKVNAAESLVEGIPVGEQYLKIDNLKYNTSNKHYYNIKHNFSNIQNRIALFYVSDGDYNGYSICTLDTGSYVYLYGNIITEEYDKNMVLLNSDSVDKQLGDNLYTGTTKPVAAHHYYNEGVVMNIYEFKSLTVDTNIPIFTDWDCLREYLETGFYNPSGVVVDYSKFQIDDNMPTIKNLKRNVIEVHNNKNSVFPSSLYDYLTWDNDMLETWELELQFVPVVQYYDINLAKNTFVKEFIGEWYSKEIFTGVRNAYLNQCFDSSNAEYITNNPDIYKFYADCEEKYEKGFFEESYLYFGYRFRYLDKANLKCSPWVVLMPSHNKDSYVVTVEYADNSTSDVGSGNGVHNKYEDLENIEDAIVDVETENKFRDEYGISDSEIDIDGATNWLQSVATFIKGTPDFVGSVMSFLPEPVRYGMFVCLFLGVIASGYAIVKALI